MKKEAGKTHTMPHSVGTSYKKHKEELTVLHNNQAIFYYVLYKIQLNVLTKKNVVKQLCYENFVSTLACIQLEKGNLAGNLTSGWNIYLNPQSHWGWKRPLEILQASLLLMHVPQSRLHRKSLRWVLNTSRGDSTNSLGSLLQYSVTFKVKKKGLF